MKRTIHTGQLKKRRISYVVLLFAYVKNNPENDHFAAKNKNTNKIELFYVKVTSVTPLPFQLFVVFFSFVP